MFVIKYDKVSMIKLVSCIEKYPAIYDTSKHYSKDEQDRSWDKVALEVGEKDSLCREKWHSIKSCYVRDLKYKALKTRRRPYYLSEYLKFLEPFVSSRVTLYLSQQRGTELPNYLKEALPPPQAKWGYRKTVKEASSKVKPKKEIVDSDESASESDLLIIDEDYDQPSSSYVKQPPPHEQPSSSKSLLVRPSPTKPISVTKKSKNLDGSTNEDVNFLKSLLNDVGRMSSHQKLKFKQETLSIIEDILYASEDVSGSC